jgi:hypothetical protein
MQSQFQAGPRCSRVLRRAATIFIGSAACFTLAFSSHAGFESGTYETVFGTTVIEGGEQVPNGSRLVPRSAVLTFDLAAVQPSLTAVIHDAVLEGGGPFELTVRSLTGTQLVDGSYHFTGDYLRDIQPSGSQYIFDWTFSATAGGNPVWSGHTYWAGGHIWRETISDVALIPEPGALALICAGAGMFWVFRLSQRSHNKITGVNAGATSVATADALGRPRRSVLSLARKK